MLVESLPPARVLLLVNYRPEYQHGWGSKTYYTQLRLDPLPEASADVLLQALLGPDPGLVLLTQLLIARTQGNPFFLEESVRTLVETGGLVGERGAYVLAQPFDTLQVPATVQALLAARIDRLAPEDKRLLQTAAVIGTEVPWPLLQAIADTPDEALYRSLAQLQAARFSMRRACFPSAPIPSSTPSRMRWPMGVCCTSGGACCTPASSRRWRPWRVIGWTIRWNGWRSMPCAARSGRRPWPMAARRGTKPGHARPTARRWCASSRRGRPWSMSPTVVRATAQAIDLRLGLRTVLTALGEAPGRMFDHLHRAETLARHWATTCGSDTPTLS